MQKGLLLMIPVFSCITFISHAQKLSPTVIPAAGGVDKTNFIQLEWTLGENAVETTSTNYSKYTQGFHQPLLVYSTHKQAEKPPTQRSEALQVIVAPNPVHSVLKVSINTSSKGEKLAISLSDIYGKQLTQQFISAPATTYFNLNSYASGIYLLQVTDTTGKVISTYKIIKTN